MLQRIIQNHIFLQMGLNSLRVIRKKKDLRTAVVWTDAHDKYPLIVVAIGNKVGYEVEAVGITKRGETDYHRIFPFDDPVTKELLPS